MRARAGVLMALALIAGAAELTAIFVQPEISLVPIERLVANLQRQLEADPRNVQTLINLGRLHAMAYALKVDEFQAFRGPTDTQDVPYYPPDVGPVPSNVRPAGSRAQSESAERHLKAAIGRYEAAVAVAPNHPTAHLGLGWALQQSGNTARAMAEYRRVIELSWPKEEKIKVVMPSQTFLTQEAISYLLPLLDSSRDAAEIQDLKSKQQNINARGRAITPVAVPLDGDVGPDEILNPAARVRFDADGSGLVREWTWIGQRAAWLVYDATGRGEIRSALQLFGNVTFWLFWENGYQALQTLDDDDDGELSGPELRDLALWHDRNSNGISEPGEVRTLSRHGIVALSWKHTPLEDRRFAAFSACGARMADGRTRPTYDVILHRSASTLTALPRHQPTIRSLATEQNSMNAQKEIYASQTWVQDRLLWRSSDIKP